MGDADAKATLSAFLISGDVRAGVAKDAGRAFALSSQAFAQGCSTALMQVAECYVRGLGVVKDAAHGVTLLRQVIALKDVKPGVIAKVGSCRLTQ
jgi:TPR repeat protein